jgi:protein-tyrosine phosphatase
MPETPRRARLLQGATNFRDLGGYVGRDGRPVRWRTLFRSDHFAGLTPEDRAALAPLGLTRSFDFRGVEERAAVPYQIDGVTQHPLSIEPTVTQRMQALAEAGDSLTPARVEGLMEDLYRSLVNDRADRFAELFEHLLQADGPVVFHCTAGKDRTGVAAALILLALGVPRAVVEADYLLTNQHYRRPPAPPSDTPAETLEVLWTVRPRFLEAAFAAIDRDHGGIERYLRQRLRLDELALSRLAERYLETA